ncbi:MAG: NAD(P)/FAD-dependent oxidoreductase, partial [Candidatus Lokiarchaeota archaeon]|nr:NAD(P)/FAD-dependent oxidoreductase [Candidatus Lokiarchaeota archaeon]
MSEKNNSFDVLVIGAGPGGSIAAKTAAKYGYSTCVIDKAEIRDNGRYKACGGALGWELIDEIGYPEDKIARIVEKLELHHSDGETYFKDGKGAVIWRSVFDKYLLDLAVNSGARIRDKEQLVDIKKKENKYKIYTKKTKFHAKYIIAADGAVSTTLKLLDWPFFESSNICITTTHEMKTSKKHISETLGSDSVHLFFGKKLFPIGYSWLFPKEEIITVGWGNQINLVKNARTEFNRFISLPFVKQALINASLQLRMHHLIPIGLRPILFKQNVFAVGDAGGLVDPISGKGIPYAMMSGKLAIESIKKCEDEDIEIELGKTYEKFLSKKFLSMLKKKRQLRDKIFRSDDNLKLFLSLW